MSPEARAISGRWQPYSNLSNIKTLKILQFIFFNTWTKLWLSKWIFNLVIIKPSKRLKIMIVDMWYVMSLFFPILIINIFLIESQYPDSKIDFYLMALLYLALINKDFVNGRSVAKRIYGYKLIDVKSKNSASEFQCMLRNLTYLIWPLEAIIVSINPKRRLGDFIANTELIEEPETDGEEILSEFKTKSFTYLSFITLAVSILFLFLQNWFLETIIK